MRFWDTSAIIPLFIAEQGSVRAKTWYREDPEIIVWTLTRVELLSAVARRRREKPASARRLATVRRDLLRAWERWSEVTAIEIVRRHAERVVERYPLRAADALQIGAAILAAEDDPAGLEFVTFDENLGNAAGREGFRVLGP
ncbi:MAG: type II toxin-antitoxin system VapC family toxin [Deltaproteobacteria bacterium]|nr:type II toxin-antitoxin system VapC family toxin [Deltaproteobacteria bacterium]